MANFTNCDLHIPYKEWVDDSRERENYSEIERWARQLLHGGCLASTTGTIVSRNLSQSIPTGTNTSISFPTTLYSSGSDVSFANPGAFTLNTTGVYLISGQGAFASSAVGTYRVYTATVTGGSGPSFLALNDTRAPDTTGIQTQLGFSGTMFFNSGTVITFQAGQDSGGNLNFSPVQAAIMRIA